MYVNMCACVYVCTYVCMYVCMNMFVCMCAGYSEYGVGLPSPYVRMLFIRVYVCILHSGGLCMYVRTYVGICM